MTYINDAKNEMSNAVQKGKKEVKEGAQDWYAYIQEHPMQTMLFGSVIYFAIKGFLKD